SNAGLGIAGAFDGKEGEIQLLSHGYASAEQRESIDVDVRESLASEIARSRRNGSTALLSGEHITFMSEAGFRSLADFLGAHASVPRAVGYVRAPKSYMESIFQQTVKTRRVAFDLQPAFPAYARWMRKFERVLGADKVQFWHFEPGTFPGHCVVQ